MNATSKQLVFQNKAIAKILAAGWQRRAEEKHGRTLALCPENAGDFIKASQPGQWQQLGSFIDRASEQITRLQERRTALISAAVTGKIDVRHWQPEITSPSAQRP
jgi:hypothetical protein